MCQSQGYGKPRSNITNIFNIHNSLALQRVLSTCCGHLRTRSLPRGPINSAIRSSSIGLSQPGSNTFRNLSNEFEYLLIASSSSSGLIPSWKSSLNRDSLQLIHFATHCVRHLREDCAKRAERYSKILAADCDVAPTCIDCSCCMCTMCITKALFAMHCNFSLLRFATCHRIVCCLLFD